MPGFLHREHNDTMHCTNDFQVESNAGIRHRMAPCCKSLAALWKHQQRNGPEHLIFHKDYFPSKQWPKTFLDSLPGTVCLALCHIMESTISEILKDSPKMPGKPSFSTNQAEQSRLGFLWWKLLWGTSEKVKLGSSVTNAIQPAFISNTGWVCAAYQCVIRCSLLCCSMEQIQASDSIIQGYYTIWSGQGQKTANNKLIISEVISFVCSDSCENGITKEKLLAKCSGKSPFSKYPWFQKDALDFSMCQMLG